MTRGLVALAQIKIDAPLAAVWRALVDPETIRQYMFDTEVVSDWKIGSPIIWKGVWGGKAYQDKGTILDLEPEHIVSYSHFSPLSGRPDVPESYHTVTIELRGEGRKVTVSLSQDNNLTVEAREHSRVNWEGMLGRLKRLLETGRLQS